MRGCPHRRAYFGRNTVGSLSFLSREDDRSCSLDDTRARLISWSARHVMGLVCSGPGNGGVGSTWRSWVEDEFHLFRERVAYQGLPQPIPSVSWERDYRVTWDVDAFQRSSIGSWEVPLDGDRRGRGGNSSTVLSSRTGGLSGDARSTRCLWCRRF